MAIQQGQGPNITPILAIIAAPFLAIWIGFQVAEGKYFLLGGLLVAAICLVILGFAGRHLLSFGIALATLDLWAAPIGFKMNAMEQAGALMFTFWLLIFWRKDYNPDAPTAFRKLPSWGFFRFIVFVACGYAFLHFLFNKWNPYEYLAFGFNGAIKTYLQVYGPFLMIVGALDFRLLLGLDEKGSRRILAIFTLAYLVVFIARLIYTIRFGPQTASGLDMAEEQQSLKAISIPVINVWDNVYTLRTVGPAATLIGATFLFCHRTRRRSFIPFLLVILGLAGSAISAGRAALFFSMTFLTLAALHAGRKVEVLMGTAFLGLLAIILATLPVNLLKDMPWHVQRSIGLLRPDLKTDATSGIQGSSDMRRKYFHYALDYWREGDPRLILLGRSVGEMQAQDIKSFEIHNESQVMFFAIRRIATHNGLTDTLIGWGAIGYILNLLVWVSCVYMLFKLNSLYTRGSHGDCWSFIAMTFMAFWLIYMHIGGSYVWAIAIWLALVALVQKDGLKLVPKLELASNSDAPSNIERKSRG
jgi:hypothetical protein